MGKEKTPPYEDWNSFIKENYSDKINSDDQDAETKNPRAKKPIEIGKFT